MRKIRITTSALPSGVEGYFLEWRRATETAWNRFGGLQNGRFVKLTVPDGKILFSVFTKFRDKGLSARSALTPYTPEVKQAVKPVPVPTPPDTKAEEGTTVIQPQLPADTEPNKILIDVRVSAIAETDASNALEVVKDQPLNGDTELNVPMCPDVDETRVWIRYCRPDDGSESIWVFFDLPVMATAGNVRDDSFAFAGAIDLPIDGMPTIVDDGGGKIEAAAGPDPYNNTAVDPYDAHEMDPYLTGDFMQEMRFYGPQVSANAIRETFLQTWPKFDAPVKFGSIDPYDSQILVYETPPNLIDNEFPVPAAHVKEVDPYLAEPDISPPLMEVKIAVSDSGSPTFIPDDFKDQRYGQLHSYRTYQPRFCFRRRGIGGKKLTISQMLMRRFWACCPCDCVQWIPWS